MITADELRTTIPGLPPRTIESIARAAVERRFAAKRVLYRAGDDADGLYVILAGKVLVARETTNRSEMLHTERAGGVLGEIPVFGGGAFPATATAIEPTRCAHLPMAAIERLLNDDPAFARFALKRMAVRARTLLRRIDELTATTITSRLAAFLLSRAQDAASADFTLGMPQEALATELGTAREVVVRSLASLVESGAIARTGRSRFAVRRLAVLRSIAGI